MRQPISTRSSAKSTKEKYVPPALCACRVSAPVLPQQRLVDGVVHTTRDAGTAVGGGTMSMYSDQLQVQKYIASSQYKYPRRRERCLQYICTHLNQHSCKVAKLNESNGRPAASSRVRLVCSTRTGASREASKGA
eukprot:6194392-Pleurochrysis_carterae.AAC.1